MKPEDIEKKIIDALKKKAMSKTEIQHALKLSCQDPFEKIRVALVKIMREGFIERIGSGKYKATKPKTKSNTNQTDLFK